MSLNPYSNGIYSIREQADKRTEKRIVSLNPYSNGIYSISARSKMLLEWLHSSLNPYSNGIYSISYGVGCVLLASGLS